jgi:hypothetical protein
MTAGHFLLYPDLTGILISWKRLYMEDAVFKRTLLWGGIGLGSLNSLLTLATAAK